MPHSGFHLHHLTENCSCQRHHDLPVAKCMVSLHPTPLHLSAAFDPSDHLPSLKCFFHVALRTPHSPGFPPPHSLLCDCCWPCLLSSGPSKAPLYLFALSSTTLLFYLLYTSLVALNMAMDWLESSPPQTHTFGDGPFGRLRGSQEGEIPLIGLVPFQEQTPESCSSLSLCHART